MQDWQQRLRRERDDLALKIEKLHSFMRTNEFYSLLPGISNWMHVQAYAMEAYLAALEGRISLLKELSESVTEPEGNPVADDPWKGMLPDNDHQEG